MVMKMKDKSMQTNEMSYFDKFLYKLFIGFLLLLAIVLLDYFNVVSYDKVKNNMSEHFNVLKVVKKINGNTKIIPIEFDDSIVVSSDIYQKHHLSNDKYYIDLLDYEAVENYSLGVVTSIKKSKDNTYSVKILAEDGVMYLYEELESIDCHLYQCVNTKEIIGKASYDKGNKTNYFYFSAFDNGEFIKIYGY